MVFWSLMLMSQFLKRELSVVVFIQQVVAVTMFSLPLLRSKVLTMLLASLLFKERTIMLRYLSAACRHTMGRLHQFSPITASATSFKQLTQCSQSRTLPSSWTRPSIGTSCDISALLNIFVSIKYDKFEFTIILNSNLNS